MKIQIEKDLNYFPIRYFTIRDGIIDRAFMTLFFAKRRLKALKLPRYTSKIIMEENI